MACKTKRNYWQQDISKADYLKATLQGAFIVILFSYVFYESILSAILLSPYLIWYLKSWKKKWVEKRKREFSLQFKEAIRELSSALNVGYSVENAMREVMKDMGLLYKNDEPIMRELCLMIRQLDMNVTMETVWKEFAVRVGDEDVQTFATVFIMAKKGGGDMIGIIRNTVCQMEEKAEVRQEIETMIAAKKLEFKVMTAIPFGMIFYMKISFPEFMNVLYGNAAGIIFMTICLVIYIAVYEWGRRIIEIEV